MFFPRRADDVSRVPVDEWTPDESQVCAAALLVAARAHGFHRTQGDVVRALRVCGVTLSKRLAEFQGTPAAQLHATIWAMARSPLMFGGKLPIEDATTLNLVTNKDALVVNEHSTGLRVSYAGDCRCSMKGRKHGNACRPLALPNAVPCVATWWSDVGACKAVAVLNIGNSTNCVSIIRS